MAKECSILENELQNLVNAGAKTIESDNFFLALRRIENVDDYWKHSNMGGMLETMSSLQETRKEVAEIHVDTYLFEA